MCINIHRYILYICIDFTLRLSVIMQCNLHILCIINSNIFGLLQFYVIIYTQ